MLQLDAPVDDARHGDQGAHVGVHLLVHQPEGQRLVSHQRLGRTQGEAASARQEHLLKGTKTLRFVSFAGVPGPLSTLN